MTVPARELRAWVNGDYPTEAAVELLIRAKGGRFAQQRQPWVEPLETSTSLCRINWNSLHQELGILSGGERRFLNLARLDGSPDHPVDLSNDLTALGDDLLLLVLAATAHAAGRTWLLAPATPDTTPPTSTQGQVPMGPTALPTDPTTDPRDRVSAISH